MAWGLWSMQPLSLQCLGLVAPPPVVHLVSTAAVAAAASLLSCPTLCDPTDGSPPGPCPRRRLKGSPLFRPDKESDTTERLN